MTSRREFLAVSGAMLAALCGCAGDNQAASRKAVWRLLCRVVPARLALMAWTATPQRQSIRGYQRVGKQHFFVIRVCLRTRECIGRELPIQPLSRLRPLSPRGQTTTGSRWQAGGPQDVVVLLTLVY